MYRNILVAIEHSDADDTILRHVEQLARQAGASLLLVHVADGFAARHFEDLDLRESEEMREDRVYLEGLVARLNGAGLTARGKLALGDPATELINTARSEAVDLVAMATHGHRFLNDLIRGTTVDRVRHELRIPVLLLRAEPKK
ncbi:MAG: universal stress protein UspA [Acidobacteria bacterium RIFCSPLOWO2_02_FULL_68_18]|nr:MAG: universal stress protein UspA [Acidobacteria bacterium RIFCSPLOWO2_02_FULL_68_18]OFW48699.1 MAG: universal stress protein UspA [Acidobacteria bacterium RIFCSPLOWO2_12_FULL_68_19]